MIESASGELHAHSLVAAPPILEAKGISKAFGHVQALTAVDFELYSAGGRGSVGR